MRNRVPFAPSTGVFVRMLAGETRLSESALRRTLIKGERLLSVPVEGGKRALTLEDPRLSDHGRWREVHLGAWNATYGKTPYFSHLFPQMEAVYRNEALATLGEFNSALLGVIMDWLEPGLLLPELERMKSLHPARFEEVEKDFETKVNYNYSIFDALFRLGKDTVFALRGRISDKSDHLKALCVYQEF